jgi:hypothetical protein
MKNFVGIGFLVIVALVVRFELSSRVGAFVRVLATSYAIPIRIIAFWLLTSIVLLWLLIAVFKLARRGS